MDLRGNIIITAEDILYDTAQSLGKFLRNNYYPTFCNKLKSFPLDFDYNSRPYKSLLFCLAKENLEEHKTLLLGLLLNKSYYNNEETFTNYFSISEFGSKINNSISLLESETIQNIYVLYSGNDITLKLLKYVYNHPKYKFIQYNTLDDCISFLGKVNWNLLITDFADLPIVYLKENINEDFSNKEILTPLRSYCKIDVVDKTLIEERGGSINHF